MKRPRLSVCLILAAASCGSQVTPTGAGTFMGADAFTVRSAVSKIDTSADGVSRAVIWLTDTPTNCDEIAKEGGQVPLASAAAGFVLVSSSAIATGSFNLQAGSLTAGAGFVKHSSGATDAITNGALALNFIDSNEVVGTASVTLGTLGTASVTFDAPQCDTIGL